MAQGGCIFCRVVSNKERSWVIYRDSQVMALLDPYPMTRGHTLIIPIRHYESMFDIPESVFGRIISLSKKLSLSYEKTLDIQGVGIEVLNHRRKNPAFRHFHLHVIPRYDKNDPRDPANVKPSQAFPRESDGNLDGTLATIRKARIAFREP
jgi:histidine triad (HIT) family protein